MKLTKRSQKVIADARELLEGLAAATPENPIEGAALVASITVADAILATAEVIGLEIANAGDAKAER